LNRDAWDSRPHRRGTCQKRAVLDVGRGVYQRSLPYDSENQWPRDPHMPPISVLRFGNPQTNSLLRGLPVRLESPSLGRADQCAENTNDSHPFGGSVE